MIQDGVKETKYIKKLSVDTDLYWVFGTRTTSITISVDDVSYVLNNPNSNLQVVSDLSTFLEGLNAQKLRSYPYTTNGTEIIALVPTITYNTTELLFQLNIVTCSTTADYTFGTELKAGTTTSIWNGSSFAIRVKDNNNEVVTVINKNGAISAVDPATKLYYITSTISYDGANLNNIVQVKTDIGQSDAITGITFAYENLNSTLTQYFFTTANGMNQTPVPLTDFVETVSAEFGSFILKSTGAMSPFMMNSNIAYINLDIKPYDENDLALYSVDMYRATNNSLYTPQGANQLAVYKYNASILANGQSEENYPAIKNVDSLSIHTYRKSHGIVDFYFPLPFLFICQGISSSYPLYASAAQSIIVKF